MPGPRLMWRRKQATAAWRFRPITPSLTPRELGTTGRRHLRQVLQSRQLQIDSLRVAGPRGGLSDSGAIERTIDNARAAMALAHDLGVHTVSVNAGPLDGSKEDQANYEGAARVLAAEADKAGILLALSGDSTAKLQELLENVRAPMLRMNLEPGRVVAGGGNILETAGKAGAWLAEVTAADVIRAGRQVRAAEMGEGQVPWEELLELLREQDFQGPLVVDVRDLPQGPQAAAHAAEMLRRLMAKWSARPWHAATILAIAS